MWQGTGSTINTKWNLSCYSARLLAVLVRFRGFVHGGGARQRQQWHLIPSDVDESRKKMADSVTRSPARLCSIETGSFVTMDALSTIFLHFFVPCFLLFLFSPSFALHVSLLRVPSSVQQPSATLRQVVRVLSSCNSCILPHLGISLFLLRRQVCFFVFFP